MPGRWTETEIRDRLQHDPRWVRRAILALFRLQTPDEQRTGVTRWDNSRGFSGFDARAGTCYARKFQRGGQLTSEQWDSARRIALKYAGQLKALANGTLVAPSAP